ncbi:PhzF family phenazine biosynthesis protein [Amycolatopsis nigrescens]|uniref:PhzF family phenazine biosynthesis protein n=1 Tax=Amycolatopsis nigrescens TaxID=381445 RepID=UPI0003785D32|nr:PhzF family phenazine biosynthesis protein [Amycolatopsis nigrescens]
MTVPLYLVDAFAHAPHTGNPAAVVLLDAPAPEPWLREMGAELNQAATAFACPSAEGGWDLRWLTATAELALCGHGTQATAHVLHETGRDGGSIRFHTKAGELRAEVTDTGVTLDFPALPARTAELTGGLDEALAGSTPVSVHRTELDYLVELGTEEELRAAAPDLAALAALPVRGLILTAPGREADFVSRFFAPVSGIPEDSVTGSAHCALAPYWFDRLGRTELTGYQASARGGYVRVTVAGPGRIGLTGRARTVVEGTLRG